MFIEYQSCTRYYDGTMEMDVASSFFSETSHLLKDTDSKQVITPHYHERLGVNGNVTEGQLQSVFAQYKRIV